MHVSPAERSLHKLGRLVVPGEGRWRVGGSVGLVGANYYIQNGETMKSQRVAQGVYSVSWDKS